MAYRTVGEKWDSFYNNVLKPSGVVVGSVQYIETRRAFYAGATAFSALMSEVTELSDDAGVAIMSSLHEELQAFVLDMTRGKA